MSGSQFTEEVKLPLYDTTAPFANQEMRSVTLWCATGGAPRHWRTAYKFTSLLRFDEQGTGTNLVRVTQAAIKVDTWEGVSLDIFQPQYHTFDQSGNNLYATLTAAPRLAGRLTSTKLGLSKKVEFVTHVTVQDLRDLLFERGLQYYKFNPAGSGCLYWQLNLLELFATKGWIATEKLQEVKDHVREYAIQQGSRGVPYPPVQGEFYDPSTL
ncbi:hypothetical protein K474DRAFT_1669511 [Panus rudis PR-1116 ss-1]|nr:hypothetical protein K474DRAFT_1669511 [Panus rudis PR-1116 ss-1]